MFCKMIVQHKLSASRFMAQNPGCENDTEIEFVEWDDLIATINASHTNTQKDVECGKRVKDYIVDVI